LAYGSAPPAYMAKIRRQKDAYTSAHVFHGQRKVQCGASGSGLTGWRSVKKGPDCEGGRAREMANHPLLGQFAHVCRDAPCPAVLARRVKLDTVPCGGPQCGPSLTETPKRGILPTGPHMPQSRQLLMGFRGVVGRAMFAHGEGPSSLIPLCLFLGGRSPSIRGSADDHLSWDSLLPLNRQWMSAVQPAEYPW